MQNLVLWVQNASKFSKCDAKSRFRTLKTKSVVKDNYFCSASFILEMGLKCEKFVNVCSHYISIGAEAHQLLPICKTKDAERIELSFTTDLVYVLNFETVSYFE